MNVDEAGGNGRPMVLEGGRLDVKGKGLLPNNGEYLLSEAQQRNPGMTREKHQAVFDRRLGALPAPNLSS